MSRLLVAALIAVSVVLADVPSFLPPRAGVYAANADLEPPSAAASAADCAQRCLAYGQDCISFNFCGDECGIQGWSMGYDVVPGSCDYYLRAMPRNDSPAPRAVPWAAMMPPPGAVTLAPGGAIGGAFYRHAEQYLRVRDPADMLHWFAARMGKTSGQCFGWGGWIPGSEAGNFLMGAGSFLHHVEDAALRAAVEMVVAGIRSFQDPSTGWVWAFNESSLNEDNLPDYCAGWVTRGLLDAAGAGVPDALALARESISLFNNHTSLATFLPANSGPNPTPERPSGWNNVTSGGYGQAQGHMIYMQEQGTIKHTLMALSPAGTQADVDIARGLYEEGWWLEGLIAEDLTAVWHRQFFSHNYEVTSYEAMADLYVLTGNTTYLNAVLSAWKLLRAHWILPGGSFALNEGRYYPPGSYFIGFTGTHVSSAHDAHAHAHSTSSDDPYYHSKCMMKPGADEHNDGPLATLRADAKAPAVGGTGPNDNDPPTGELCGNVFWALLNSRFHRLWPTNESFVAEIERSILNVGLAALGDIGSGGQGPNGTGIRYFANQHKQKQFPSMHASCCEGQGTRLFGSLPSFLYTLSPPDASAPTVVYVDIYAESSVSFDLPASCGGGKGSLSVHTAWPTGSDAVNLALSLPASCSALTLSLRMPAWLDVSPTTGLPVLVNGVAWGQGGMPGTYLAITGATTGSHTWDRGSSSISFTLPMALVSSLYTGSSQLPPYTRYSFLYGPVLMSFEGPWDQASDSLVMPTSFDPTAPTSWLKPAGDGNALHFTATSGGVTVIAKPYWEVNTAGEMFTNYPSFKVAAEEKA